MRRDENMSRLLIGIIGGVVLIMMTMITSLFIVTRRPTVVILPSGAGANVPPPVAAAAASSSIPAGDATQGPPPAQVEVTRVTAVPSVNDPLDPAWEKIASVDVVLGPQQVAQPVLEKSSVAKLRLQAVRDDQRFAWRLSWNKDTPSESVDIGQFTDAVAMQFPLVDSAPYTMGGPNLPVRMLYWKAAWQKDVDKGFQDLAALHPGSDPDLYWFASSKNPSDQHAADGATDNDQARQWMVAARAGNPMADYHREHPIEELTAHGFGSGTHVAKTPSRGRGVWRDGQWFVVIDRPIQPGDPLIERFQSSPDKQLIAFAVWDGENANRGGKKHITNWLPMRIAK